MFYQKVLKPILFKFDPEKVHNLIVFLGPFLGKSFVLRKLVALFYKYKGRDISKTIDGLTYRTPFILSAGFDYNGKLLNILPEISFGGVEVGSITARACLGNKKPRLTRLPKSQSIIVNKGLCNDGVDEIIKRLKNYKRRNDFVIGISIARTNDEKASAVEEGVLDYFYSFKRLNEEDVGDYYTLNISCPNSFTGGTFTNPALLSLFLSKISPINLEWPEFDNLLKIIEKFENIKGVVIGNLNKDYNSLDFKIEVPKKFGGGLSGKPCFEISNELIKKTKVTYGNRFTIIGCGGVFSSKDMISKFEAGSDLVALITGMIYNGPGLIKELSNHYATSHEY